MFLSMTNLLYSFFWLHNLAKEYVEYKTFKTNNGVENQHALTNQLFIYVPNICQLDKNKIFFH